MIGARLSIVVVIALLVVVAGAQAAGNGKSGPKPSVTACQTFSMATSRTWLTVASAVRPSRSRERRQGTSSRRSRLGLGWNNPLDPENPTRGNSAGQWMQEGVNVLSYVETRSP